MFKLFGCFLVLMSLALLGVGYPLKKTIKNIPKIFVVFMLVGLISMIALGYYHWGSWSSWQQYLHEKTKQEAARAWLASVQSTDKPVEKLLETLKAQLDSHPDSARGWYLLGRLYASQNQWRLACDAFTKSKQLNADDELTIVNYAQSLWQLNRQQFNQQIRQLFMDLLRKNPNQPDALAMLALDAHTRHDYAQAIAYWQRLLLTLTEQHSQEANTIRKAIAKAQQNMTGRDYKE